MNRSINTYKSREVKAILRLTDSALAKINANLDKVQLKFLFGDGLSATGLNIDTTDGSLISSAGIYNHTYSGKLIRSYKDSSIDVRVEKVGKLYIAKVWVQNPSRQVCKAEAGWGKRTRKVGTMLNPIKGAIVGINGSGFYRWTKNKEGKYSGWRPGSHDSDILKAGSWNFTTEGDFVMTNGTIRRKLHNKTKRTLIGITKTGEIKYYYKSLISDIINDGVYNTFTFGPLLIQDGKSYTQTSGRPRQGYSGKAKRTLIGQVDSNNYIFMVYTGSNNDLKYLRKIGLKLHCRILFNLDGGGSAVLWFRNGTTGKGQKYGGSRSVADALYFSSLL